MTRSAGPVFTPPRRWLLRRHVPVGENVVSIALLVAAAALVAWVLSRADAFDPSTRDLTEDVPAPSIGETVLYKRPLQPWVEPGAGGRTTGVELGAFPASVLAGEWRAERGARRFGAENLYEKINGEAEKFLRQGFRAMDYIVLRSPDAELSVELYDQGEAGGAMGIFADHLAGDRAAEERSGVVYFETSAGVIGRAGRYFFRAAGDGDAAALRAKSAQLVDAFATLAQPGGDLPAGQRVLAEGLGVPAARITFEQANVFQFDFASEFWFGAVAAEGGERAFVHEAASPAAAAALFQALVDEQSYDYDVRERGESVALLWHQFLETYFALSHRGRFLFGVEGVAHEEAVGPAMARLEAALEAVAGGTSEDTDEPG